MKPIAEKTMLIGIGAQKTGTTWLYNYLDLHPEVFMSPYKETHVFDHRHCYSPNNLRDTLLDRVVNLSTRIKKTKGKKSINTYRRALHSLEKMAMIDDIEMYMEHFKKRVKSESVFGEITPAYSLLPKKGFEEILSLHSNVKFIFIMRDPVRRAWSHINDQLKRKGDELSYEERVARIFSRAKNNGYFLKSNYEGTIRTLESVVKKENILYLFYEDLFCKETVEQVCQFLDVSYLEPNFEKKVNLGKYEALLEEDIPRNSVFSPIYQFCLGKFGDRLPSVWRQVGE